MSQLQSTLLTKKESIEINENTFSTLVNKLYAHSLVGVFSGFSIASILYYMLLESHEVNKKTLNSWYGVAIFIYLFCFILYISYKIINPIKHKKNLKAWSIIYNISLLGFGILWGSFSIFLMPQDTLFQSFIILLLFSIAAAFAQATAGNIKLGSTIVLFIISPVALWCFHQNNHIINFMGIGGCIFTVFLLCSAYLNTKTLNEAITLRHELDKKNIKITNINTEVTNLAKQVAHDIRSPLTVLDIITKDITSIPEDEKILFRNAIDRIHDIANNLLARYSKDNVLNPDETVLGNSPQLISDLVSSIVSEKLVQYKNTKIKFIMHIDPSTYGCFVNVSASDFKRTLSNLLNNAIESLENNDNGQIQIKLTTEANQIKLSIQDNGCGISSDILPRITAGKVISQKKHGHGLGLSYAIQCTKEKWGGQFHIQSHINEGTIIEITLPKATHPI